MAYVTGTANALADLLTAIQNACTANGWTLAGNVLYKGTCYVEVKINGAYIQFQGGTGIDGSNNLTGRSAQSPALFCAKVTSIAFAFPVTYEVFIGTAPDEVYVVCTYATSYYQMVAFGQSAMPGLVGSGNWYCGPSGSLNYSLQMNTVNGFGEFTQPGGNCGLSLFCRLQNPQFWPCGVDHSLDASSWQVDGAVRDAQSILYRSPNAWNSESILIPIRVYAARPTGFFSPVLECAHARLVDISALTDGQILTLGSDRWKIYPWWHRGAPHAANTSGSLDSSTFGHAFRYDGP